MILLCNILLWWAVIGTLLGVVAQDRIDRLDWRQVVLLLFLAGPVGWFIGAVLGICYIGSLLGDLISWIFR